MSAQGFYVYAHKKASTGEVFYIGKGKGKRARRKDRTDFWCSIVEKHGLVVEIFESGLQEWAAFELEASLIALYGRRDQGLGPLINLTDGGDGAAGVKRPEEIKSKIRSSLIGRKRPADVCERIKAGLNRPEVKERRAKSISSARKGKPMSASHYEAYMAAHRDPAKQAKRQAAVIKACGKPVRCKDNGRCFATGSDAAQWLRSIGFNKAGASKIFLVCKGDRQTAYGYRWEYVPETV